MKLAPKWKIILVLLILNVLGFWAAQSYFNKQESSNTDREMVEEKPLFGTNVKETGVYKEYGIRLLALFLGR